MSFDARAWSLRLSCLYSCFSISFRFQISFAKKILSNSILILAVFPTFAFITSFLCANVFFNINFIANVVSSCNSHGKFSSRSVIFGQCYLSFTRKNWIVYPLNDCMVGNHLWLVTIGCIEYDSVDIAVSFWWIWKKITLSEKLIWVTNQNSVPRNFLRNGFLAKCFRFAYFRINRFHMQDWNRRLMIVFRKCGIRFRWSLISWVI